MAAVQTLYFEIRRQWPRKPSPSGNPGRR
jgi:hypothetical protein